jgi:hypothetical protein
VYQQFIVCMFAKYSASQGLSSAYHSVIGLSQHTLDNESDRFYQPCPTHISNRTSQVTEAPVKVLAVGSEMNNWPNCLRTKVRMKTSSLRNATGSRSIHGSQFSDNIHLSYLHQ